MAEDTIHGYAVIGRVATGDTRDGKSIDVVLVERDDSFVTAKHVRGDSEWCHGNYFHWGQYNGHPREDALRVAKEDMARRFLGK